MSTQVIEATNALIPTVTEEQLEKAETKRNGLLVRAQELVVNSPETEKVAWDIINGIGELKASIVTDFAASKEAAHKAHKAICAQEKSHLDNLVEPDRIVRDKLSAWEGEKKRLREEEERKAREAAEAERKRLQAEADERARQEQERLRKEAEDARIAEALKAEAAGKSDVAAAILEKPIDVPVVVPAPVIMAPAVIVPSGPAKVEGAGSMVENWYFTIENEESIPREYLVVDQSAIQKVVTALKSKTKIAGVKVYSKWEPRRSGKR